MVECPTCGDDYSEHGVKLHHGKSHGEKYYAAVIRERFGEEPSEYLERVHRKERTPLSEIAETFDTSSTTIKDLCESVGVDTLSPSEAREAVWERKSEEEREEMVSAAHEKTRTLVEEGEHNFQDADFERVLTDEFKERAKGCGHALFRTNHNGYESWRSNYNNGEVDYMKVHRLLAVAEYGVEAVKDKVIHHKNGLRWDNRPENIVPMGESEHLQEHYEEREIDDSGRFV